MNRSVVAVPAITPTRAPALDFCSACYVRWRPELHAYLLGFVSLREEAEDLTEDAFDRFLTCLRSKAGSAGVDAGTGVDTGTGVNTGTGADTGTGVDTGTDTDTGVCDEAPLRDTEESPEQLHGWLFTIAHNLALDQIRRRGCVRVDIDELAVAQAPSEALNPEDAFVAEADRLWLESVLDQLQSEESELITARYFEGLTCSAIARRNQEPAPNVRQRLVRTLAHLRRLYPSCFRSKGDGRSAASGGTLPRRAGSKGKEVPCSGSHMQGRASRKKASLRGSGPRSDGRKAAR